MKSLFTQITTDKEANITGGAYIFNALVFQGNSNLSSATSLAIGGGSGYYGYGASASASTYTSQFNNIFVG